MDAMTGHTAAGRRIAGEGTPDSDWQAWDGLRNLPPVSAATLVPPCRRAVIVAPHPDDEVLACGGLLQLLAAQGSTTLLVAVTDGTASHPGSTSMTPEQLARLRPGETGAALRALGLGVSPATPAPCVLRVRLPDGAVEASAGQLQTLLELMLRPDDVVFVTWRQDGHPDHEACGLAAAMAASGCGATLIEMPVWSWHWAAPGDVRVPWHRAHRLVLSEDVLRRKREAVRCFTSQLHEDTTTGQPAILPPHVLARLLHPYEIYFI